MVELFGRDPLRETVLRKYDQLKTDNGKAQPFVVYRGVPGIGKTALLRAHIADVTDNTHGYGFYVSGERMIEAARAEDDYVAASRLGVLREIATSIDPHLVDSGYHDQIQNIDPSDSERLNAGYTMTADKLASVSQLGPVFLALDDWSGKQGNQFYPVHMAIERDLLLPIAKDKSASIVTAMATRTEVRFRLADVRRITGEVSLSPLELQDNWSFLNNYGDRFFHSLTQGIPLLDQYLLDSYGSDYVRSSEGFSQAAPIAQELATVLLARVPELQDPVMRQFFEFCAQFREFELFSLRSLFPEFDPSYKESGQSRYTDAFKIVCQTGLVEWSTRTRSFVMKPEVRRVVANALRFSDPARYYALHADIAAFYLTVLKDVHMTKDICALEYVYHMEQSTDQPLAISRYVDDVRPFFHNDFDRFTDFSAALAKDTEIASLF